MAQTLRLASMFRYIGKKVSQDSKRSISSHAPSTSTSNSISIIKRAVQIQVQPKSPSPSCLGPRPTIHGQACRSLASSPSILSLRRENSTSAHMNYSEKRATSKVLYDGDCKICQIEISALRKWTEKRDNIEFIDISKPDYNPQQWGGVSYEDAMKEMHVVGPDGKVYTQGDAIRHMYRACGLGFLSTFTELPLIRPVCDELYVHFARYRLQKALARCDSNSCDIKLKHLRDKIEKESKT